VLASAAQNSSPHLADEVLHRYHLGQIADEAELHAVEAHLSHCRSCRERASTVEDRTTILRIGFAAGA
jgi:anti-sigma factor RsiW